MLNLSIFLFACGPKDTTPAGPIVGWHREEGWTMDCYHPPNFDNLNELDRRVAREMAMDEVIKQWRGQREDGIHFEETVVEDVETTLLGRPEKVEVISRENLTKCKSVATASMKKEAWYTWISGLKSSLTAGECNSGVADTIFDYLDIEMSWTRNFKICTGDRIVISGTANDKYKIEPNGPWINVAGDPNRPAVGTDLPCATDECYAGQLLMRFTAEAGGWEEIIPVGERHVFVASQHGFISYTINDNTYYDNEWYQSGGLVDHTAIEISPGQ